MIAKTIEYYNYKGEKKTGTYYFHLKPGQLMRVQADTLSSGYEDFAAMMRDLVKTNEYKKAYEIIEKLLVMSYGEMTEDGEHFRQTAEITDQFASSAVLDGLVIDILTNVDKTTEFFEGLIPKELMQKVVAQTESGAKEPSAISVVK